MPWYLIAALFCMVLAAILALVFVVIKTAFRVESLEVSQHEMQEGAIRRDAVAVQVGRVLALRLAKAELTRLKERELRAAACSKQEKDMSWVSMHEHAISVIDEELGRVKDELFKAGDREDSCKDCRGNHAGRTGSNVVRLCDYCTTDKEKPTK